MRPSQTKIKQQAGQILILIMIIVAIGLVIALSLVQLSMTQKQTVRYEDYSIRAYYAAEAGVEETIPLLKQAVNLNGTALDDYLAATLTTTQKQVLDGQANTAQAYAYTRVVERSDPQVEILRSIDADAVGQFDLSDTGATRLENTDLAVSWTDSTCTIAGCNTAVEVSIVTQIEETTNLVWNPSFEAPVIAATQEQVADNWIETSNGGATIYLWKDPEGTPEKQKRAKYGSQSQKIVVSTASAATCTWVRADRAPLGGPQSSCKTAVYTDVACASPAGYGGCGSSSCNSNSGACFEMLGGSTDMIRSARQEEGTGIFYDTSGTAVTLPNNTFTSDQTCKTVKNASSQLTPSVVHYASALPLVKVCPEPPGLTRSDNKLIPLLPHTSYALSAYVQVESLGNGSVQILPSILSQDTTVEIDAVLTDWKFQQTVTIDSTTHEGKWVRIYSTFTTPTTEGGEGLWLRPEISLTNGGVGSFWVDGVQLEAKSYATPYCDGNQGFGEYGSCSWQVQAEAPFSNSLRGNLYTMDRYLYDPREIPVPSRYASTDRIGSVITVYIPVEYASGNRLARVRAFFGNMESMRLFAVNPENAAEQFMLPGQEIVINSTGYFADTKKAVSLRRGLPTLLPQFDYVLFNNGCVDGAGCVPMDLMK
jgi:hypothetical protein